MSWALIDTKETSGAKLFMAILVSGGNNIKVFLSDDCIVAKGIGSLTKCPKQYEQKCTKKIFKHILAYFWHFYRRRFGYFMHITLQFID